MDKKIYITGGSGMVGSNLIELGCSRLDSDVRDIVGLDNEIRITKPEIIIHLASKSGVDYCERTENSKIVRETNVLGSSNVFSMAEKHNVPVVFISSDQVFSGRWFGKYKETSSDFHPRNNYGFLKFVTEASSMAYDNVKIVRTSTLFKSDRDSIAEPISKMLKGESVTSPVFLFRSFMHVKHFALSLVEYCNKFESMPKVLHLSGASTVSWHTFLSTYAQKYEISTSKVIKRYTEYPHEAQRPYRVGLSTLLSKSLGITQYDYLDGIKDEV